MEREEFVGSALEEKFVTAHQLIEEGQLYVADEVVVGEADAFLPVLQLKHCPHVVEVGNRAEVLELCIFIDGWGVVVYEGEFLAAH